MSDIDLSHNTKHIKDLPAYYVSKSETKNEKKLLLLWEIKVF